MNIQKLLQTPIQNLKFAIVDTETTGMYANHNKIMDIGIITMQNGKIESEWETLIDPKQEVPWWITKYTHLESKHVIGKPTFDKVASKIQDILNESIFVAHNVDFDFAFLRGEFNRLNIQFDPPKLCTVKLGRKLLPQLANAHLDALSDFYNIKISQRHRALPDAQATAVILMEFIKIAEQKYNAQTFFDLDRLQKIKIDKSVLHESKSRPQLFD